MFLSNTGLTSDFCWPGFSSLVRAFFSFVLEFISLESIHLTYPRMFNKCMHSFGSGIWRDLALIFLRIVRANTRVRGRLVLVRVARPKTVTRATNCLQTSLVFDEKRDNFYLANTRKNLVMTSRSAQRMRALESSCKHSM